jgi:tripartite-type tricarboxylate transporter receptor subunit TctC
MYRRSGYRLFKRLNYDPAALEPVAIRAVAPNVLSVKSSSPAKTVTDLIAHAKASPGKISYASQGNGSTSHLTAELFASRPGVKAEAQFWGSVIRAANIAVEQ